MRVIICGAGQVGYNIAAYLAKEENDVTVVDLRQDLIARIHDELDVNAILGHASFVISYSPLRVVSGLC